jgi:HAD superfamily hydrolase (TIGR01509 family)
MGVIYPVADDLRDLLIPYLRSKDCSVPDEVIIEAYRACYRGGAPAQTIWDAAGLDAADETLEHDYLACYELNEGVVEFLEAMQSNGIPVYGLSNDVGEWAPERRKLLGIDQYFDRWIISSEVGAPKPAPAIYQRLIEILPCSPEACVFVDDRAENLEAAATHGLGTVLFGSEPVDGVRAVSDFRELTTHVLAA